MKKTIISVTEAARNFADCVNRVRYQNVSFVLLKNGTPVARIVPEQKQKKKCTGRELAKALRKVDLSASEARAWHRDLVTARKALKPPKGKWR
ncbi:MAG TPA: type II toxin-antitoxin system prevent-host-death family antitoxin [Candidatus Binataceae bacterium]|nr:type II toxin-antitoxin system prevent-host-death family antitoxin [Candidatus Binataceae bacterium]